MNTLTAIFDWLLIASFRASVLTLLVLVIQWMLKRHLSPRWRYALWLPVLIVLLAPVLPESRWSIESVFQAEPQAVEIRPATVVTDDVPVSLPPISQPVVSTPAPVDWRQIQLMTWALGSLLLLLIGGVSFLRTLLRLRKSRQSVSDDLLSQLDAISREVGLRHSPQVLVAPAIQSPAVTGLLRPTLLLPAGFERDFTVEEARLILQHELTHLKRHDLPLNALLCVLMALHWFNPLLWLAFFKARADREAACDAQVLANATPQRRSEYGHALLKVEAVFVPLRLSLGFVGMLQRGAALRARIRSIALPSRTRPLAGLLAGLCILGMTFLGITRAEKPTTASNDDTTLVAIEVKTVRFLQDTPWDFGGRLKQIDPTDDLKAGVQIEVLSKEGLRELLEQLQQQAGADIATWPRVVTKDGKEVVIRSVVNQPVLGGKDTNGKDLITYLPIGFIGKFTPKVLPDGKVNVNIDLTDSRILATVTISGSEYPVASSRVYRGPVALQPGITVAQYGWQGHGWKNGKPQSYRPTVTFIAAHVIDPKEGGLPTDDNTPTASFIENKLRTIILPRVQFSGAPIEDVVEFLRVKSREFDTVGKTGVQFILRAGDTKPAPISLDLTKVPLVDVLHYSTELAGLKYKVEPYAVTIGPAAAEVPAKLDITANETSYNEKTGIWTAKGDAKTQFGKMTIQAHELVHDQKNQQLQMIAPFVLITEGTKQITSTDAHAVATLDLKTGRLSIQGGHKTQILDTKDTAFTRGDKIILPRVEFRDATLASAIDFICIKSREFDPDKKGVHILLKDDDGAARITLSLKDVPVSEALRYCAELANCNLNADENAFVLSPRSPKDQGAAKPPANDDASKATELRRSKPQQYDFAKAMLGDVLRFLATEAGINFVALPDDHPAGHKLVTFSIKASPFEVLENLCRTNGLVLLLDKDLWYIRPADDQALVWKAYAIPQTATRTDVILQDIRAILNLPDAKAESEKQEKADGPRVTFLPAVKREACVRAESESFMQRIFGGAAKPLLVHFAQNSKLTAEEVKELKKILDQNLSA